MAISPDVDKNFQLKSFETSAGLLNWDRSYYNVKTRLVLSVINRQFHPRGQ